MSIVAGKHTNNTDRSVISQQYRRCADGHTTSIYVDNDGVVGGTHNYPHILTELLAYKLILFNVVTCESNSRI